MIQHTKTKLLIAVSVLVLASCGGNGGAGGAGTTASGRVIDGYIGGAKVCFDLNKNIKCDADEPFAMTAADGSYTLTYSSPLGQTTPIVVEIPVGAVDVTDGVISLPYWMQSNLEYQKVISPFTTLAKVQMDANSGQSFADAAAAVNAKLGLNIDFTKDHIIQLDPATQNAARALVAMMQNSKFNETKDLASMDSMLEASKDVVKWSYDNSNKGYVDIANKISTVISKSNVVAKVATPNFSSTPRAVVADSTGLLYALVDTGVLKFDSTGSPVNFASFTADLGSAMVFDSSRKNLYVANGTKILKVDSSGVVTTVAGGSTTGHQDGALSAATFDALGSIAVSPEGKIYVVDNVVNGVASTVRIVDLQAATVSTLNFQPYNTELQLPYLPKAVAVLPSGELFILQESYGFLLKDDFTLNLFSEMSAASAFIGHYSSVAVDGAGSIYVFDSGQQLLKRLIKTGAWFDPVTIAGGGSNANGGVSGNQAKFNDGASISTGPTGSVYVLDTQGPSIYKVK